MNNRLVNRNGVWVIVVCLLVAGVSALRAEGPVIRPDEGRPHVSWPDAGKMIFVQCADILSIQQIPAVGRPVQTSKNVHQC